MKLVKIAVDDLSNSRRDEELHSWLAAEHPDSDFRAALCMHCEGTGSWLIDSPEFRGFLDRTVPFLWLHGLAGCGKTVLSSYIISSLTTWNKDDGIHLVYFYFNFRDVKKQSLEHLLRSLVMQLVQRCEGACERVMALQDKLYHRQPGMSDLEALVADIIGDFECVRVIIDARDESCTTASILDWIRRIMSRREGHIQLIVTSRDEEEIRSSLLKWAPGMSNLALQEREIDADIRLYVRAALAGDERFERWQDRGDVREKIENSLTAKADAM